MLEILTNIGLGILILLAIAVGLFILGVIVATVVGISRLLTGRTDDDEENR